MNLTLINDFIDFNYQPIAFDITGVDREELRKRLRADYVNHLYELEETTKYIAIWNCDLQGFNELEDVYIDSSKDTYALAKIIHDNNRWFYYILNSSIPNV